MTDFDPKLLLEQAGDLAVRWRGLIRSDATDHDLLRSILAATLVSATCFIQIDERVQVDRERLGDQFREALSLGSTALVNYTQLLHTLFTLPQPSDVLAVLELNNLCRVGADRDVRRSTVRALALCSVLRSELELESPQSDDEALHKEADALSESVIDVLYGPDGPETNSPGGES